MTLSRIKLLLLIPAATLLFAACQNGPQKNKSRYVNDIFDEVLTSFPELEATYSYEDSTVSEVGDSYYLTQVYYRDSKDQPFTGKLTDRHWNDSLKAEGIFEDGKVQRYTTWHPNGNRFKVYNLDHKNGKITHKSWHVTGELASEVEDGITTSYYKSGAVKSVSTDTSSTDYWENGNKKTYWPLENGRADFKPHGEWKAWHENGTLGIQGTFVNGKKDGRWLHHDSTGTLTKIVIYDMGAVDSTITNP